MIMKVMCVVGRLGESVGVSGRGDGVVVPRLTMLTLMIARVVV